MPDPATNYRTIAARAQAQAAPHPVTIIAVAKTHPSQAIRTVHSAGATDIGENYLQEAEQKIQECRDLPLTWHYIGRIQSRKAPRIARLFQWAHGIDHPDIAQKLSAARAALPLLPPLNILLQINISDDPAKAGFPPQDQATLAATAARIATLPALRLRGLMTIPNPATDPLKSYQHMAHLKNTLTRTTGIPMDTLSMGMSTDYPQAIQAGATHIRIGTQIFGPRPPKT